MIDKYVGHVVVVIYEDRYGKISKRRVKVREVTDHHVKAYCLETQGPRLFTRNNILAIEPTRADETTA